MCAIEASAGGVFLVWAVFLFNKRLEISLDVMNDDVFVELPK